MLFSAFAFLACSGDIGSGKSDGNDLDTGSLLDGADTAGTDDTDDTDDTEPRLVHVRVTPDSSSISSGEKAEFTVTAVFDDESEREVTADARWESEDETVAKFYEHGVAQPLTVGSSVLTATWEGEDDSADLTVTEIVRPGAGDLVFNEVLVDVPVDADVNGDGTADSTTDEFAEIANRGGSTVDLSGITLWDGQNPGARHTFADGTILMAGEAVVVYGGGVGPAPRAHCTSVVAVNDDIGLKLGLALNNEGDTVRLLAAETRDELATMTATDAFNDASWVLDPDFDGSRYTAHSLVGGAYSPCAVSDGGEMPGPDGRYPL